MGHVSVSGPGRCCRLWFKVCVWSVRACVCGRLSVATVSLTVVLRYHVLRATMRRRDVTAATRVNDCASTYHPQVWHLHELHGSWVMWVIG